MLKRDQAGIKRIKPDYRLEGGQGLVEFALGVTFLVILLAGVLDFGRAYLTLIALQDAAQEGAMYGSLDPTVSSIQARVHETPWSWPIDFSLPDFPDAQIVVQIIGAACEGADNRVRVEVTHNFEFIAPFIGGKTLPLKGESEDTILLPTCP